ncbi:MAG: ABC transporter permease [Desulfobulbaceae bacterium]|nr:ABC transporter permease [Desulfobulbaceae bacterium]
MFGRGFASAPALSTGAEDSMKTYIAHRLLQLIPIVLGITFFSFALMQSVAGDAVDALYDNISGGVSEEIKAERRAELGLDKPFLVQYANWLKGLVQGDMGISYLSGKAVFPTFMSKLPATLLLMVSSISLTVTVSIPLGVLAAVRQNRILDYVVRGLTFAGNSLPGFFTSLLLIYFFSLKLRFAACHGRNHKLEEHYPADLDPCHCNVIKIYPASQGDCA